ncbi:MAG: putative zinc-binding metallopeptidase, partial [Halioglobus sp.]|nr:putative zinc-binding metallopeptidase [Halioglobus sp.]
DYGEALARYYENGPARDWHHNYISAYASAHPVEDWAESWGHYLHIYDALETAATHKLNDTDPAQMTLPERIAVWRELTVSLNELNRSLGRPDAYPFLINAAVERKLAFVDNVIRQLRTPAPGTAGH